MCGLTGFVQYDYFDDECIIDMVKQIKNRGPNDCGYWIDNNKNVALGHTRLSIQDLTEAGKQPMISKDSKYVLIFNGEIYNFIELKEFCLKKKNWSYLS